MKSKKLFAVMTLVMFMMTLLPMVAFGAVGVTGTNLAAPLNNPTTRVVTLTVTSATAADFTSGGNVDVTFALGATAPSFDITKAPTVTYVGATGSTTTIGTVTYVDAKTLRIPIATADSTAGDKIEISLPVGAIVGGNTVGDTNITATGANAGTVAIATTAGNRHSSIVMVDKTTVDADGTSTIKVSGYIRDQYNQPINGAAVFVNTDRNTTDDFTNSTPTTNAAGYFETKLSSYVVGTAKVGVAVDSTKTAELLAYLQGATGATADAATIANPGAMTVTFGASSATGITLTPSATTGKKANGLDYYEITALVKDTSGNPVANQNVSFSVDKAGASLSKYEGTTNAVGELKTKVYCTAAAGVTVTATAGSITKDTKVTFDASGAYDLVVTGGTGQKVARGHRPSDVKVRVVDINGNTVTDPANVATGVVKNTSATFVSKPSGTNLVDGDLTVATETTTDYCLVKFAKDVDKVGIYTVRLALDNGKAVTVDVEVAEQGPIVGATLKYNEKTLALASTTGNPSVKLVDADGIGVNETRTNFTWASSNTSLATVDVNGKVKAAVTGQTKKGTVTITAVHKTRKFVATADIEIGKELANLTATEPAIVNAGETSTVTIQLVDEDGTAMAFDPTNQAAVDVTVSVASKPEGAIVSASLPIKDSYQKSMTRTGSTDVTVKSDKSGVVKLAITATEDSVKFFTAIAEVEFGTAKVVAGAKKVTMFIGATGFVQDDAAKVTDVAPFIQDSRTFVAVRPIADAFGAEIGWDEATQTVTLTRDDMTLTIVIGSNVITKVADGVTTTSEADVAAFIKDGRTVLPFRAVGEAFGATVEYDAATQAVSFTQ